MPSPAQRRKRNEVRREILFQYSLGEGTTMQGCQVVAAEKCQTLF